MYVYATLTGTNDCTCRRVEYIPSPPTPAATAPLRKPKPKPYYREHERKKPGWR